MKNIKKRVTSALVAAATVMCAGTATIGTSTLSFLPGMNVMAFAEEGVAYTNAQGQVKIADGYERITKKTAVLSGGWYVVDSKMTIDDLEVTGDSYIIITDGSRLTVKHGINVARGCKFNVYTQPGGTGMLLAGTTNGNDSTAGSGNCGIGGPGAKINIVGGNVYARGGSNAYGIQGSDIHLYWTNPTDSIYASSYSTDVQVISAFAAKSGKLYHNCSLRPGTIDNTTLEAVRTVDGSTTEMNGGNYAVFDDVRLYDRVEVSGDTTLYLANGGVLTAEEGISVPKGSKLTINGNTGKLYAGTRNGSSTLADDNNAGVGSTLGSKAGDIVINGGSVYANGGTNAAGIGGSGSFVQINGGTISAKGGLYGAGIGSNSGDSGCDIKILGGNVTATGGKYAAGIGDGYRSSGSSITLSYTNYDDKIDASSFSCSSANILKTMYTPDGQVVTRNNINSCKKIGTEPTECTVTFNSNGGTYVDSKTVQKGGYINSLPTPRKNGFIFGGWFTDKNFYYAFTTNTRVTGSMTVYAKWIAEGHTVTFVPNNGKRIDSVQVQDGGYLQEFQDPTRNGYVFNGWYTDPDCKYRFNFRTTRVYTDLTLYADWIKDETYWIVTFDAGAGRFPSGDKVWTNQVKEGSSAYGSMPSSTPIYTQGGTTFIFDGWYYDGAGNRPYSGEAIYNNTTLYASYHADTVTYTVTFDAGQGAQFNNGNRYVYINVDEGDMVYGPTSDPFTLGGDFAGYFDSYGNSFSSHRVYSDETYVARFNPVVQQGTIHFVYDYAEDPDEQITEDIGRSVPANSLAVLYKAGHNYDGWYYDSGYTQPVYGSVTISSSDVYLYAYVIEDSNEGGVGNDNGDNDGDYTGSTFNGGLIAAIAGGVVLVGGGIAAGVIVNKKKKNK